MQERTMSVQVSCPRCGESVDPQARRCTNCGVDLAHAAILAEQALASSTAFITEGPIAPEILVPRLGEYLLERGVLTQEELQRAVEYQSKMVAKGQHRLVGRVLLELGMIDREMLDQAITEQILQLQNALQQSNRQLEQRVRERTQELQQALNRLTELSQLKSNFISNVSHELRTPLTHIKGYLDLLADGSLGPLTREQSEALDVLLRSETRLEELIEELLQFSLAASDQFTLKIERIDVNKLVAKTISQSMDKAKLRGISMQTNMFANLPEVNADVEKITWVLIELLDNAIKFTPYGGRVLVETSRDDNKVIVSVKDTGIGISPERITEIFEPFHQLDGSVTRRYGGVGLGLALMKNIIEAHGTTISVSSGEGEGTRFEFALLVVEETND
jgi:signal transduction histidine kinase